MNNKSKYQYFGNISQRINLNTKELKSVSNENLHKTSEDLVHNVNQLLNSNYFSILHLYRSFDKPQGVFLHVHKDHIISLPDTQTMKCSWGSPEGTGPGCKSLRPKYSLLTHLQDFHCGVQQLQQAARRNQQLATKGVTDVPQIVPPAHPGYANNAAFMAIKRHSTTNLIETRPVANISPLSKSVRLTAAMILRNLLC